MSNEGSGDSLHIDTDWKTEAAQEKERLTQEDQTGAAAAGAVPGQPGLADLVNMLAMQGAIALGGFQGPGGEQMPPNPAAAKHYIDLLDVLDNRTKGNLTDDEQQMLDKVLYELRMQYVQMAGATPPPTGPEVQK